VRERLSRSRGAIRRSRSVGIGDFDLRASTCIRRHRRCTKPSAAYNEYAAFVGSFDPPPRRWRATTLETAKRSEKPLVDPAMTALARLDQGSVRDALKLAGSAVMPHARAAGSTTIAPSRWPSSPERTRPSRPTRCRATTGENRLARQAIAIYGRARALHNAGRCTEASGPTTNTASSYAARIRADAEMATVIARGCIER